MRIFLALIPSLAICVAPAFAQTHQRAVPPPPQSQSAIPYHDGADSTDADGNPSGNAPSRHALVKDCIAQKQRSNSGMSKTHTKKACRAQMKDHADPH